MLGHAEKTCVIGVSCAGAAAIVVVAGAIQSTILVISRNMKQLNKLQSVIGFGFRGP